MAGTGKSTISRTVARYFADQRRLGASFFFSRGQGDLGHAEKFFTTIASQIAHALPTLKRHICEAVAEDHRIGTQGLSEQWKKLVFRPLSKLENSLSQRLPIILVIDALDECEREDRKDDTRVILRLLAEAKDLPTIQLRIFLTSRPEVSIYHGFSAMSKFTHQDCILHHISKDIIEHDILIFIRYEFERIRKKRLLSNWPKVEDINSLARDANGLFIYAATICRFVDRRHPKKQLSIILQCMGSSPPTLRTSPTQSLDEMYSQVLKSSISMNYDEEDREEILDLFKQTVGSIVILSNTLSTTALASLLDLLIRDVDEILKHLQAVLDVPDALDLPVRLIHPSFRDFLLDKNRCSNLHFWVDERQAHRTLADDCIRLMSNSLKQDVCRQVAPGTFVDDVERSRIEQFLPPEVRYACLYWIQHLQKSGAQLHENDHVYQFLQKHLLHWLEALGWIRKTSEGIFAILSLEAQISVSLLYDISSES
jgi:NACHT domain